MFNRKHLVFAVLVAAAVAFPPAASAARVNVELNFGPPPPIVETVPPPRVGYVWAPGYWEYRDHDHHWVRGHWIHERRGYAWAGPRWEEHNGRWRFEDGHWERHHG
jgi:hypothetical protein